MKDAAGDARKSAAAATSSARPARPAGVSPTIWPTRSADQPPRDPRPHAGAPPGPTPRGTRGAGRPDAPPAAGGRLARQDGPPPPLSRRAPRPPRGPNARAGRPGPGEHAGAREPHAAAAAGDDD